MGFGECTDHVEKRTGAHMRKDGHGRARLLNFQHLMAALALFDDDDKDAVLVRSCFLEPHDDHCTAIKRVILHSELLKDKLQVIGASSTLLALRILSDGALAGDARHFSMRWRIAAWYKVAFLLR